MNAAFRARALSSVPEILAAASGARGDVAGTVFQSPSWLRTIYESLAPATGAAPFAIAVEDALSGNLAALIPLAVRAEGKVRVASFPDLGVSDYGAPLLGPGAPEDVPGAEALWAAARNAIEADLVRLGSMPRLIEGRINPLAAVSGTTPSRHSSNHLTVSGTIEDFLRDRGKKYRKEVERCLRLLSKEGEAHFRRAQTPHEIASSYIVLQTQQSARHHQKGGDYALDDPAYAAFYERLLQDGVPQGEAHIFKLSCGDEIVATLLGVSHRGAFTLLRISNGGERWQHLSPGRLIVIEAMKYFVEHGVRTFDMGIGDYPFKRGFGIEPEPLADLVAPLTWRGVPAALLHQTKSRARRSPRLKGLADLVRGRAN